MKVYCAFYSKKQEHIIAVTGGTVPVYRLTNGTEAICTELKETKEGHNFSDSVYLGEVKVPGSYIRSIKARG